MKDKRLLIIFMTVFIDLVGFGIIIPLNPYLAEDFHASPLQVGLLMSIFSLFQFIFSPVWGRLSDQHGRRPIILVSLLGAAVSHALFGLAGSFWGLVVARGLAGLFGGNISAAMAYIADITEEKNRSKGMGLVGAAFGLGFVLGPLVGGLTVLLGEKWRPEIAHHLPAFVASTICFVNFLFALRGLPESRPASARTNVSKKNKIGRFARIASGFRQPVLGLLIFLVFLNTFAMAQIEAPLFLFMGDEYHWSLQQSMFGFAYIGIVMVITQGFILRKLMPKLGERRLMFIGISCAMLGFFGIGIAKSLGPLAFAITLLGLGNGLANPALTGSVSLVSGKDEQGANLGISQSLSSLARILGPPIGGILYQSMGKPTPFLFAGVLACVGASMAWVNRSRLPEHGGQMAVSH
jgi:MFS family permease